MEGWRDQPSYFFPIGLGIQKRTQLKAKLSFGICYLSKAKPHNVTRAAQIMDETILSILPKPVITCNSQIASVALNASISLHS